MKGKGDKTTRNPRAGTQWEVECEKIKSHLVLKL